MNIALYVVLGLSVLVDLVLGAWASAAWGSFVSTWHLNFSELQPEALRDTQLLGLVLGFCLFCFAALQALAIYWIRGEKEEGHRLAILFGGYLIVSSLVTFAVFHRPEFLLMDGLRGGLLVVLAVMVLNAPATVRELRLPDASVQSRQRGGDKRTAESRAPRPVADRDRRDRRGPGRPRRTMGALEDDRPRGRRRRGGRDEDRSPSARRERSQPRAEEEPRDRPELKDRLRPLITSVGSPPEAPLTPPAREVLGGSGRRERGPEEKEPDRYRSRRPESRPRAPEETPPWDAVSSRRVHPDTPEEQPLTVVVHGGPDLRARAHPLTPESPSPETVTGPRSEADDLPGSGDRRRRRRRRRPRGGRGMDDRPEMSDADSEPDYPPDVVRESEPESEPEIASRARDAEVAREESRPDAEHSSAYVEALDKLSLLEPRPSESAPLPMEYGRTRKPVIRRRPTGAPGSSEREGERPRGLSAPGPASAASRPAPSPSPDSAETGPRPGPAERDSSREPWPTDPVRQNDEEDADQRGEDS